MAFDGTLVQLKKAGTSTYMNFPLRYIKTESYKVTPDQRMESSASRSATGLLKRTTCSHTASKVDFTTITLTNSEVKEINKLLTDAYTDSQQRKLELKYYNPSTDTYKTGEFYVPDIDFDIIRVEVDDRIIHYDGIRIAFIEY